MMNFFLEFLLSLMNAFSTSIVSLLFFVDVSYIPECH